MWGTFTSSNSVLLLIDHQVGTMKLIKTLPLEVAKQNTLALAKAAKVLGIPVILTTGTEERFQGPLLPELKDLLPEEHAARIKRGGVVNTWEDPDFRGAVEKTQRRNLIMAGVTTDVCLYSPAISATEQGYQVQGPRRFRLAHRAFRRDGPPADGARRHDPDGHQHGHRRVRPELEPTSEGGKLLDIMVSDVLPKVF
jgi:hypothetical protein